ncbi:DNA methyltransferase [Aurantimonas sp. C2-5-R2]|nr:DNA methyltransferase [Aurantimonas sp. C2-4-R8]
MDAPVLYHRRQPVMPKHSSSRRGQITPATGIFPELQEKSRIRRETQRTLTALRDVVPPPRNDLQPSLQIEYVPIESVKPASRRVRRAEVAQAARLDASFRRFGLCEAILVDEDRRIVHGHGRWEAARRAGLTEMPVIEITHLDPAERRALSIALNRLGETGNWDEDALKLEVVELMDLGEDVLVTGFDAAEIDALLLDDEGEASDEEALPELPTLAVSRSDDLWALGDHLLLQGDALEARSYERLLEPTEHVRLVLTDVPYNVPNKGHVTSQAHHREFAMAHGELSRDEFADFNVAWMRHVVARLGNGGLLATFIDWRSVELVLACGRELDLNLLNVVVWAKSNGGMGSLWRSQHEMLPVFKKGKGSHINNVALGHHGRWRSNLWTYAGGSSLGSDAREASADHPTVKPKALLEDALLDVTNRGETVLDPFVGSGSTILAAESTGRVCLAIEIDGRYCDVAIKRWESQTGEAAVLVESGETFEEVARRREAENQNENDIKGGA